MGDEKNHHVTLSAGQLVSGQGPGVRGFETSHQSSDTKHEQGGRIPLFSDRVGNLFPKQAFRAQNSRCPTYFPLS